MQMQFELDDPEKPRSPLRKLAGLAGMAVLLVLVLMFSVVVLAIILVAGALAWAYLWWKGRELRKQMRAFSARAREHSQRTDEGDVFEGEVIRVVESRHER